MNIISLSGIANCTRRVYSGAELVNALRVSRSGSCVVGAERGGGTGFEEENPLMDQSTMQDSRSAFERMRSWWKDTQSTVREWTSEVLKCG